MVLHFTLILFASISWFEPATCRIFHVSNVPDLADALDLIQAGDKVLMQPGTYRIENFELPELGHGKSHTLLTSATQNASSVVITGRGKDPPLIVNGTRWALTKFTISNKLDKDIGTGVVLKLDDAFLKGLIIRDVDVAVQSEGNRISVQDCEIHSTKVGLYMFGNASIVIGNKIHEANPCIFVDDLSCCGAVKGNRCDVKGAVFVNGQKYEMDEWTKRENDLNKVGF